MAKLLPLHRMDWAAAKRLKWEAGRRKHRKDERAWSGRHPLIEAYDEAVDLSNYLDEAASRGLVTALLQTQVVNLAADLRVAIAMYEAERNMETGQI